MIPHFELKRTENGRFLFNLKAGNGETILTSGLFDDKAAASKGIATVIASARNDSQFERKIATNKQPYFVLNAATGEFLAKSETYSSSSSMENGIKSVIKNASEATLKDLTEAAPELAHK